MLLLADSVEKLMQPEFLHMNSALPEKSSRDFTLAESLVLFLIEFTQDCILLASDSWGWSFRQNRLTTAYGRMLLKEPYPVSDHHNSFCGQVQRDSLVIQHYSASCRDLIKRCRLWYVSVANCPTIMLHHALIIMR